MLVKFDWNRTFKGSASGFMFVFGGKTKQAIILIAKMKGRNQNDTSKGDKKKVKKMKRGSV
jgi:hypothetical protein